MKINATGVSIFYFAGSVLLLISESVHIFAPAAAKIASGFAIGGLILFVLGSAAWMRGNVLK